MRAYYFVNWYLSSIQQSVQALHATSEMFVKYGPFEGRKHSMQYKMLIEWAKSHKTVILLNGGHNEDILNLYNFLYTKGHSYPWSEFYESEESLGGIMTAIGIILPERIYGTSEILRDVSLTADALNLPNTIDVPRNLSPFELELIDRINQCSLAR
jgi:hypothetical protein